jgi:phosphoesterase RecJ-like protein
LSQKGAAHPPPGPRHLAWLGDPLDRTIAEEIEGQIRQARHIAILGHEHPDGDCLGSAVALCSILRLRGCQAQVFYGEPVPRRYTFLNVDGLVAEIPSTAKVPGDLIFVLDTTDPSRLGGIRHEQIRHATLVNIDHHIFNHDFGEINWVDTEAAATGELIWRLASARGWPAPPIALEALYAALVTDTGQFAYSNTNARVLRMAADLVEAGVDPETMWRRLYLNKTPGEMELEARARDSFEVWGEGRIAVISVTYEDFTGTMTSPEAANEFASIPRQLAGSELAIFFYEIDQGRATKVSIRSQRAIDACELARQFGGGGHRQAAGCRILAPLSAAKARFRPAAEAAVKGGSKS